MNDDTLNETARHLGAEAAARLDVERTAQAVIERLRSEPRAARWTWMQPSWLRIAAAAVLFVGGAVVVRQALLGGGGGTGDGHSPAHFVSDDLRDLSADQLREVLGTLDETLDLGRSTPQEADLENLDARQLRALLSAPWRDR